MTVCIQSLYDYLHGQYKNSKFYYNTFLSNISYYIVSISLNGDFEKIQKSKAPFELLFEMY